MRSVATLRPRSTVNVEGKAKHLQGEGFVFLSFLLWKLISPYGVDL